MKPLKSTMYCHFCKRHFQCFYNKQIKYNNYKYYICPELHDELMKLPEKMMLIYHITINLNYDMKNVIFSYICAIPTIAPCIITRQKIVNERNKYLNYNFNTLTIKQLKALMIQRKLKVVNNQRKTHYINELTQDVLTKAHLWKYDDIGIYQIL